MDKDLTIDQLEMLLDSLTMESDDYVGVLPIDLDKLDLCEPDGTAILNSVINPTAPNTMEEIEALCNSDYIQNLLDTSKMEGLVKSLMQEAVNKRTANPPLSNNGNNNTGSGNNNNNGNLDNVDNNLSPEGNIAIVEFGDDYTKGKKVEYELYVKPCQLLNSATIMGTVEQYGVFKKMRSVFSKGVVLSKDEECKYFEHLFPSKAKRHILIANYQLCDGVGYDDTTFANIGSDIAVNTELYNLIKDHICYSTLPLILSNHESKEDHTKHPVTHDPDQPGIAIVNCDYSNSIPGIDLYNTLMDKYIKVLTEGGNEIRKIVDAKKIQKTNGSTAGMNAIKDEVMAFREKLLKDVINVYLPAHNYHFNTLPYNDYKDCLELSNVSTDQQTKYEHIFQTGNYANYYMYLLSCLDISMLSSNKYYKEYHDILTGIIEKRNQYESETLSKKQLIKEFNDLFKDNIRDYTDTEKKNNKLGYNILKDLAKPDPNGVIEYVIIVVNTIHDIIKKETYAAAYRLANAYIQIEELDPKKFVFPELYEAEKQSLIKSFNKEFKKYIQLKPEKDGYNLIKDLKLETADIVAQYLIKIADNLTDEKQLGSEKLDAINRIARLFVYLKDMPEMDDSQKLKFTDKFSALDLVKEEAKKLRTFWQKCILDYNNNSIDSCLKKMEDEVERLSQYAEWPVPITTVIEGQEYLHFIFKNPMPKEQNNGNPDDPYNGNIDPNGGDPNIANYDITNTNTDRDPALDLVAAEEASKVSDADAVAALNSGKAAMKSEDDPLEGEYSVTDTEYWVRYFSLATIISLPFLADGFDVPPTMTPIPMPGIYIAFKAIYIKIFDVVIVMGLAIRGIWIFPIVLIVNLSNKALSVLTPLIAILNQIREMFKTAIGQIEMTVPNLVNLIILKLEKENDNYRKQNKKYEALLKMLENMMVENDQLLLKHMRAITHPGKDERQNIFRTNDIAGAELESEDTTETEQSNS